MSGRLDQEREQRLQPRRMATTQASLESMGYEVEQSGPALLTFQHNGATVWFWPYSGWFSGKTVRDGRGFENLARQLRRQ
jgi:hypothetical protein